MSLPKPSYAPLVIMGKSSVRDVFLLGSIGAGAWSAFSLSLLQPETSCMPSSEYGPDDVTSMAVDS